MNDTPHVTDQLPAYALGALDRDEAADVALHLATCASCRADLAGYQDAAARIGLGAPEVSPPADLGGRIMARVTAAGGSAAAPRRRPWWQQLSDLVRGPEARWAVATLALVVLLVTTNMWWYQKEELVGATGGQGQLQVIALVNDATAPDAAGSLVISRDGEHGTLIVDGLPVLDAEHAYQLWLIKDGHRTNGGVFSVNAEGYGALWVSSPEPLSTYPAVGITIEPAGGSPGPTGERVLGGSL